MIGNYYAIRNYIANANNSVGDDQAMSGGILVCGLNGSGKSTFGQALAKKLNYHFIDIEDLYFEKKRREPSLC